MEFSLWNEYLGRERERWHREFLDSNALAQYLELYYKLLNWKYTFENCCEYLVMYSTNY